MCLSSRNLLIYLSNICVLLYHRSISSEFRSFVRQDKLFRIDSGCGKPEGDGLEFFSNQFYPWFFLNGRGYTQYCDFTLVLTVEVELSEISLAQLPAIYAVPEHSTVLLLKQGEAACRHSSSPTGIFTHLVFSSLVRSLFYLYRLYSIYNLTVKTNFSACTALPLFCY